MLNQTPLHPVQNHQNFSGYKIQGIICPDFLYCYFYSMKFDIVGFLNNGCRLDENGLQGNNGIQMTLVGGVCKYFRILIKKK